MHTLFGAEVRRVEDREFMGKPALAIVAERTYDTSVEDLWEALTTPERLARWFLPVEGDLKVGGRYELKGNASGTITRCDGPHTLELTWEYAGTVSWVVVRLAADRTRARLTLEHIAPREGDAMGAEHFETYGPAAGGVGWDLSLHGLAQHLANPTEALDAAAFEAWTTSSDGKSFVRGSGEAWGAAHVASGADPSDARAKAERTIVFYGGA